MKILLSPCLYCENKDTFDLNLLGDTLEFIDKYLNVSLDEYTNAFYSEERLTPPLFKDWNKYNEYANVIATLRRLKIDGDIIEIENNDIPYDFDDSCGYIIINNTELQYIIDYIYQNRRDDYVFFLGEKNSNFNHKSLNFVIKHDDFIFPVVKNPWLEKSDILNKEIKINDKNDSLIFKNRELCCRLDELMKNEAKNISGELKGAHYKKYGQIIAYRNCFEDFPLSDPYEVNTDYYKRKDGKYIISIDLIHGHFEVFYGSNELWFAEYSFSGEELYAPKKQKELNEMRKNHKVRKRHH